MLNVITGIVSILLVVGLPVFFVYKLYKLLSAQLAFNREEKAKMNKKRLQYLDLQMRKLQGEIDFYAGAVDASPARSKGGGFNGRSNKSNKVADRTVSG